MQLCNSTCRRLSVYVSWLRNIYICLFVYFIIQTHDLPHSHFRFGAPGVEFSGWHADENQIVQLHFLTGEVGTVYIIKYIK